jgi:hypothetical protein
MANIETRQLIATLLTYRPDRMMVVHPRSSACERVCSRWLSTRHLGTAGVRARLSIHRLSDSRWQRHQSDLCPCRPRSSRCHVPRRRSLVGLITETTNVVPNRLDACGRIDMVAAPTCEPETPRLRDGRPVRVRLILSSDAPELAGAIRTADPLPHLSSSSVRLGTRSRLPARSRWRRGLWRSPSRSTRMAPGRAGHRADHDPRQGRVGVQCPFLRRLLSSREPPGRGDARAFRIRCPATDQARHSRGGCEPWLRQARVIERCCGCRVRWRWW